MHYQILITLTCSAPFYKRWLTFSPTWFNALPSLSCHLHLAWLPSSSAAHTYLPFPWLHFTTRNYTKYLYFCVWGACDSLSFFPNSISDWLFRHPALPVPCVLLQGQQLSLLLCLACLHLIASCPCRPFKLHFWCVYLHWAISMHCVEVFRKGPLLSPFILFHILTNRTANDSKTVYLLVTWCTFFTPLLSACGSFGPPILEWNRDVQNEWCSHQTINLHWMQFLVKVQQQFHSKRHLFNSTDNVKVFWATLLNADIQNEQYFMGPHLGNVCMKLSCLLMGSFVVKK